MSIDKVTKDKKRVISLPKAIKIMQDYKLLNYNAYQTLVKNGYSKKYADANARYTIEACSQRIKDSLELVQDTTNKEVASTVNDLYGVIGITREKVLKEYQSIVEQNINIAVKLRALEPLLKQEGINWDDKQQNQAQAVNIVSHILYVCRTRHIVRHDYRYAMGGGDTNQRKVTNNIYTPPPYLTTK